MRKAAGHAVRRRDPAWLVLAVPEAPPNMLDTFREAADENVCLAMLPAFGAIGFYYRDFHQMSDAEVTDLLARTPPAVAASEPPER